MKIILYLCLFSLFLLFIIKDTLSYLPDGFLHIYILDIGQGDSTLIETPEGRYILIDAGEDSYKLQTELQKIIPWYKKSLDIIILTHPDKDHYYGFTDMEKTYTPKLTLLSNILKEAQYSVLVENLSKVSPISFVDSTTDLQIEDISLDALSPFTKKYSKNYEIINNGSLTYKLQYKDFSMLLTADIETETIEILTTLYGTYLDSNILKASHHGSKNGYTDTFLKYISPEYTTISAGLNNKYGHPNKETLSALEKIKSIPLNTIELGTIHIKTDGKTIEICRELPIC